MSEPRMADLSALIARYAGGRPLEMAVLHWFRRKHEAGLIAYAKRETIATECGCSSGLVHKVITRLSGDGLLGYQKLRRTAVRWVDWAAMEVQFQTAIETATGKPVADTVAVLVADTVAVSLKALQGVGDVVGEEHNTPPPPSEVVPAESPNPNAEPGGGGDFDSVPEDEPFESPDGPFPDAPPVPAAAPRPLPDGPDWTGRMDDAIGTRTATRWAREWGHRHGEADADRIAAPLAHVSGKLWALAIWHDFEGARAPLALLRAVLEGRVPPAKPLDQLVRWSVLPPRDRASISPLDAGGVDIQLSRIEYVERRRHEIESDRNALTDEEKRALLPEIMAHIAPPPAPAAKPERKRRAWQFRALADEAGAA